MASAFAGVAVSSQSQNNAVAIRGNAPRTVQWRLEGLEIPNPNHFAGGNIAGGGFVTIFSSQLLADSDFLTGAFPAEYGNAVSSVLDVETRQGNSERYAGKWDLGLLTSKLTFEGPLPRGSFLVSGRRTYIDAITWVISKAAKYPAAYLPYYFYDLQAKANFDLAAFSTDCSLWATGSRDPGPAVAAVGRLPGAKPIFHLPRIPAPGPRRAGLARRSPPPRWGGSGAPRSGSGARPAPPPPRSSRSPSSAA